MSRLLTGNKLQSTYENFVAECPHCQEVCTFNRVTDLRTCEPIDGMDVCCFATECAKPFRILYDLINPRHQMLVFDSEDFFKQKRYMYCILNLCQAYEVFFSQFLRVELVFKPLWNDQGDRNELNSVADQLRSKTEKLTFSGLRKVFLRRVVDQVPPPANLTESRSVINELSKEKNLLIPGDHEINKLADQRLVPILMRLKASEIHEMRNRVIHKEAYRPSKVEAETVLIETKSILMPLTHILDIQENINWYRRYDVNDDD